ncbi:hypothetical protein [Burkholderia diffusa]|uniref:hypothetical protein n=1 Tax=Burkholderia diffusa TaxID=488732 RepID=UPI0012D91616|nr:hypothetical protein [Burkholderia diffusa]
MAVITRFHNMVADEAQLRHATSGRASLDEDPLASLDVLTERSAGRMILFASRSLAGSKF